MGGGNYERIPGFVYGILIGYFIFFNTFPVNMALQYKKYGEQIAIGPRTIPFPSSQCIIDDYNSLCPRPVGRLPLRGDGLCGALARQQKLSWMVGFRRHFSAEWRSVMLIEKI